MGILPLALSSNTLFGLVSMPLKPDSSRIRQALASKKRFPAHHSRHSISK